MGESSSDGLASGEVEGTRRPDRRRDLGLGLGLIAVSLLAIVANEYSKTVSQKEGAREAAAEIRQNVLRHAYSHCDRARNALPNALADQVPEPIDRSPSGFYVPDESDLGDFQDYASRKFEGDYSSGKISLYGYMDRIADLSSCVELFERAEDMRIGYNLPFYEEK